MQTKPPKSTLRKVEESLGAGLITGALVFVGYASPSASSSGWAYLPYIAGFSSAVSIYFVLSQFARGIPKWLFYFGLLVAGCAGGLVSFLLTPPSISIAWYLLGGVIVFLAFWYAEIRERPNPRSA